MTKKVWTAGELITKTELDKLLQDLQDEPLYGEVTVVTETYSVLAGDAIVLVDSTGGAFTVTLPAATGSGRILTFKKTDVAANAVTLDGAGAETIDGAATNTDIDAQWDTLTIVDGASGAWSIIQRFIAA